MENADSNKQPALKKKKTHVTIYDLAAELKVSPSTVSRALNGHPGIGKERVKAIIKLAKKRNYVPNDMAAGLRQSRSNNIGVITTWIDRNFHSSLIRSVEEEVSSKGMNVIILQSHDRYKDEVENAKALLNSRVSGLIVSLAMETRDYGHFKPFFEKNIPVIFADRVPREIHAHKVLVDNFKAAYRATSHLIEQGYKHIAHLSGQQHRDNYLDRQEGYVQALKDHGLKVDKRLIYECETKSAEEGVLAVQQLLSLRQPPDALFSTNDTMAISILQYFKKIGIHVPRDFGIVGFNNDPITSIIDPPITTTYNPAYEIGKHAAKLLLEHQRLNWTEKDFKTIRLDTELIIRESTMRKKATEAKVKG